MKLVVSSISAMTEVPAADWNALVGTDNPFIEHGFLALLEASHSVGPRTPWLPAHLLVHQDGLLVGAAPTYLRTDSSGEYIFDWGWAEAAHRAGLKYYPKISVAVPFTPATGSRLLTRPGHAREPIWAALLAGFDDLAKRHSAHSVHILFCRDDEAAFAAGHGYIRRASHQYHFRNPGYAGYDAFLADLRSASRKQLRKERQKAQSEPGITIETRTGDSLSKEEWARINALYLDTAGRKWGRPYLSRDFFALAKDYVAATALVVLARREGQIMAMALSFSKGRHLYGRYWGTAVDVDSLHFELCYHQLIDYAIDHGLSLVEAGAQGEHKLKRGFVPVITHSVHRLYDTDLAAAVARAVARENLAIEQAMPELLSHTPFRDDTIPSFPLVAGVDFPTNGTLPP